MTTTNPSSVDGLFEGEQATSHQTGRRSVLKGLLGAGALFTLGGLRSSAYAASRTTKKTTKKRTTKAAGTTKPSAPTTKATVTETTKATASPAPAANGAATGKTSEMVVSFTYKVSEGGRVRNPYIAVWIETPEGQSVRTVALQYQTGKGNRWLPDLRRWYSADQNRLGGLLGGSTVDVAGTMSSPTRSPGSQRHVWDGTDDAKVALPVGNYVLWIEAAREKGNPGYALIKEPFSTAAPFSKTLADNAELVGVTVELR